MFSHNAFLKLGTSAEGTNMLNLMKNGYELSKCNYSFLKSIDNKGQVQSNTTGGIVDISIPSIPTKELIEWSLNSRKYLDGMIVFCDDSGIPLEKIQLFDAACVSMEISYIKTGNAYISTSLVLSVKKMTIGRYSYESKWINK
ncbi:type VI secretion system tube protein TssD [Bacteroides sp. 224]|uniref:type VI secretion system tube protein TssD n=1 Tax=Bacteroides sp. 224 TaxID=2302936 RepID=UPI0013D862E9|nr:type VI secretion system tube protein TssD [Bacteroides sp. 224]NDV65217.1 type VI secretion system needle protein Hcp [Bacteroides sp. 224]